MKNHVIVHVADKAIDKKAEDVARRGHLAGRLIARAEIEDGVSHACVVPGDMPVERLRDYVVKDFAETREPLHDPESLRDRREIAAAKRATRERAEAREAERKRKEAEAAERDRKAQEAAAEGQKSQEKTAKRKGSKS